MMRVLPLTQTPTTGVSLSTVTIAKQQLAQIMKPATAGTSLITTSNTTMATKPVMATRATKLLDKTKTRSPLYMVCQFVK